jgi:hypothetical protein
MAESPAVRTEPPQRTALERARWVSELLDESVRVPGIGYKIGLDPLIGILPVAGDAVSMLISLYVVVEGIRAGAPVWLVFVMLLTITIDFLVGSIPVIGVVFDAVWKANKWNVSLLERVLVE